jgi:hypothetical protein
MTREEFIAVVRQHSATLLADQYLHAEQVHMFISRAEYDAFRVRVATEFAGAEAVSVVGSGNWGYSLNPDKALRQFDANSDVDVAVISRDHYQQTWDLIRHFHRTSWYAIDFDQRQRLRRNGENIYAGFVSPNWIPDTRSTARFEFRRALNRLSDNSVGFRKVNALFFRNVTEAADYYVRGFSIAKASLSS